jgi:hypothetical protein
VISLLISDGAREEVSEMDAQGNAMGKDGLGNGGATVWARDLSLMSGGEVGVRRLLEERGVEEEGLDKFPG